mmetsp:Transcript_107256/g.334329  ORF Transcript_107256/g.334329 Transcript_107256/m.334329 type:complete len:103 (+) Transcript_107256:76-384(+)
MSEGRKKRDANKRANHNALERKRRDHIKEQFATLKSAVPAMSDDAPSRSAILNKATDYIREMKKKALVEKSELEQLQRENDKLMREITDLEASSGIPPDLQP